MSTYVKNGNTTISSKNKEKRYQVMYYLTAKQMLRKKNRALTMEEQNQSSVLWSNLAQGKFKKSLP